METRRLEKEARARVADLRTVLRSNPQDARKALEKLLTGPLVFTPVDTPEGPRFQVTGEASLAKVFEISIAGVPNGTLTVMNIAEAPEIAGVRVEVDLVA